MDERVKCMLLVACIWTVNAKECAVQVKQVIKREVAFFNRTNYRDKCKEPMNDYHDKKAMCNGYFLHPKCVCSFYMYELGIKDVCDVSDPQNNGSLEHVTVNFCRTYSYTKNGPCQNNGTLIASSDLAKDATCRCKENYSGEYCDVYNGKIKCQDTKPDVQEIPSCDEEGFNGRYCLSKVKGVSFWCDSEYPVRDDVESCSVLADQPSKTDLHRGSSGASGLFYSAVKLFIFVSVLQML